MTTKITYATMSADNEELNAAYEEAVERVKDGLGQDHPFVVNGRGALGRRRSTRSGRRSIPKSSSGATPRPPNPMSMTRSRPPRSYFPTWSTTPWRERVALMRTGRGRHGGPAIRPGRDRRHRGREEPPRGAGRCRRDR